MPRRILLATLGSLGDLHPYLALSLELKQRGHAVTIATSDVHAVRVEQCGLAFAKIRPDEPDWAAEPDLIAELMDAKRGSELVVRRFMIAPLRDMFEDLTRVSAGHDLLVGHPLTPAIRLVAELQGVPWVSSLLAPLSVMSADDPPVLPILPALRHFRWLGRGFHRALIGLGNRVSRPWFAEWDRLRAELGLPSDPANPIFFGQHAPRRALALFSGHFAAPQSDWPPQLLATGFPFFEPPGLTTLDAALGDFLRAGDPPVIFTLGSSAVKCAAGFYQRAKEAVAALRPRRRAVFLVGEDERNQLGPLDDSMFACAYADHGQLFPRSAAVVHQGGIGTTAQALRAGVPALIVPFAHDQFDNGHRVERLGVGRLGNRHASGARLARDLDHLLSRADSVAAAQRLGERIRAERGTANACDALLSLQ